MEASHIYPCSRPSVDPYCSEGKLHLLVRIPHLSPPSFSALAPPVDANTPPVHPAPEPLICCSDCLEVSPYISSFPETWAASASRFRSLFKGHLLRATVSDHLDSCWMPCSLSVSPTRAEIHKGNCHCISPASKIGWPMI